MKKKSIILSGFITHFFRGPLFCTNGLKTVKEDFKPASTNQPGKEYPQVNSEGRVRAQISAPGSTQSSTRHKRGKI